MGGQMSQLIPGLFVGNLRNAQDEEELKKNGITHILSIHDLRKEIDKKSDRSHLKIVASDNPQQKLSNYFRQSNTFIHEARTKDGACLVHCMAGVSRSVTICIAYIMTVTDLPYQRVMESVRGLRQIANPNYGFHRQLQEFETSRGPEEKRQLLEKDFGKWKGLDEDIAMLDEGRRIFQQPSPPPVQTRTGSSFFIASHNLPPPGKSDDDVITSSSSSPANGDSSSPQEGDDAMGKL